MAEWKRTPAAAQLAAYLRGELLRGRWMGKMPGVMRLADELGVARDSVEEALRELAREGVLRSQGPGHGRIIDLLGSGARASGLRVEILLGEPSDRGLVLMVELVHALQDAGHKASVARKTLDELGDKVGRVARLVEQSAADAWVVFSSTREVLEWFAAGALPAFALAGRANRLGIASIAPDKTMPIRMAVRRLVELGHRKIVLMVRSIRRIPDPGMTERAFLEELELSGILTGPYNLPDWRETVDGFRAGLESLFKFTPPTAVIIDEAPFVTAALQFCMSKGLRIPEDFSLICTDPDPTFEWCLPSIAHLAWDRRQIIRRIVQWSNNVSLGREDRQKSFSKGWFVEGGSIGPVKGPTGK